MNPDMTGALGLWVGANLVLSMWIGDAPLTTRLTICACMCVAAISGLWYKSAQKE